MMTRLILTILMTVGIFVAMPAQAGNLTIPNTFQANTPAKAAEVNANFTAVSTAVNSNTTAITNSTTNIKDLLSKIEAYVGPGLNIDFGSLHGVPPEHYYGASTQKGVWNQVADVSGTAAPLLNLLGETTTSTISVTSDIGGGGTTTPAGGYTGLLLSDNFYSMVGNTWTVTLNGITNGDYALVLYAPYNPAVSTGSMTVNSVSVPSLPGGAGTLIQGTSYESVSVTITNGTLVISGSGASYTGLAGLQLIPSQ